MKTSFFILLRRFSSRVFSSKSGFSLIESLLAIGIIVMSVIPLMGLLFVALKPVQISVEEIEASHLLSAIIQDFRYSPQNLDRSAIFKISPTPWNNPAAGESHEIWVDSLWNVYSKKPAGNIFFYLVTWTCRYAPDENSLMPTLIEFKVIWPPEKGTNPQSKAVGELTTTTSFLKIR